jgi:hypothetical protein
LRLQGQFDDVFRLHGGPPESSRRKKFGAKPEVWDTWIEPDDEEKDSAGELADIKPLAVMFVPQETRSRKDLERERRYERSSAFLASILAHPIPLSRYPVENDRPGGDSANSSSEIPRTVQVSVVISMPSPPGRTPPISEFPNVAIGFARLPITNE